MDKIREICRKTAETIEDTRKQDCGGEILNQDEIVDLLAIFYRRATADGLDEGAKILDAYIMMPHLASRLREEAREFRRQASPTIHVNNPIRKGVLSDDEIDEIERWATGKPLIKEGSIQAFPSSVLKLLQSHKVLADRLKVVEEDRACRVRQVDVLGNQISALGKENQELRVQIVGTGGKITMLQNKITELHREVEFLRKHTGASPLTEEQIKDLEKWKDSELAKAKNDLAQQAQEIERLKVEVVKRDCVLTLLHFIVEHDGDFDNPETVEAEAIGNGLENVLKLKQQLAEFKDLLNRREDLVCELTGQLAAMTAERDATQQNMEANGVLYRKAIADKQDLEQQLAASQARVRELEDKLKEVL